MRYYKCELHTHTRYSDGSMTPAELAERAAERGYDIIVSTDHNTKFAVPYVRKRAEELGVKVISGIEWTTFWGHLNATGGHSKVDWRSITPSNIDDAIKQAAESGDVITLCHPKRLGGVLCGGCYNDFEIKGWENVAAFEVWSHTNPSLDRSNLEAKREWVDLLDAGYKIAAVYGYDWHRPDEVCPPYAATYVAVDGDITDDTFADAIRARHTYISLGITLDYTVSVGGKGYLFGDDLPKGIAEFNVKAVLDKAFAERYKVEIISVRLIGDGLSYAAQGDKLTVSLPLSAGHLRAEVCGKIKGEQCELAITSPCFITEV